MRCTRCSAKNGPTRRATSHAVRLAHAALPGAAVMNALPGSLS